MNMKKLFCSVLTSLLLSVSLESAYQSWAAPVTAEAARGNLSSPVGHIGGVIRIKIGTDLSADLNSPSSNRLNLRAETPLLLDTAKTATIVALPELTIPAAPISAPAAITRAMSAGRPAVSTDQGAFKATPTGAALNVISGELTNALGRGNSQTADGQFAQIYDGARQSGSKAKRPVTTSPQSERRPKGSKHNPLLSGNGGASRRNPPGGNNGSGTGENNPESNLPRIKLAKSIPPNHRTLLTQAFQTHSAQLIKFLVSLGIPPAQIKKTSLRVNASKDESPGAATVVRDVSYSVSISARGGRTPSILGTFQAVVDLRSKQLSLASHSAASPVTAEIQRLENSISPIAPNKANSKIRPDLQKELDSLKPGQTASTIISVDVPLIQPSRNMSQKQLLGKMQQAYFRRSKNIRRYLVKEKIVYSEQPINGLIVVELTKAQAEALDTFNYVLDMALCEVRSLPPIHRR